MVKAHCNSDINSDKQSETFLENGIIFNYDSKIILAENFFPINFLVSFPKFELIIRDELDDFLKQPSLFCHLELSSNSTKTDSTFDVHWLLHQVKNEVSLAKQDLTSLRKYTASMNNHEQQHKSNQGQKRAPALGIAALALVGLFGGGISLGKTADCGLRGIFGSCNDKSKENAENIVKLPEFASQIPEKVHTLAENLDDKFFMVTSELNSIKQAQDEMIKIQNRNWEVIQEHFEVFKQNNHTLRDCDQRLFTRQQINFNYDTVSSLLAITFEM